MNNEIAAVILTDTHLKESNIDINLSVFEQAVNFCLDNNLKTIYHLGDIFDSRKALSLSVLSTFKQILDLLYESEIQLITIPGNHDRTWYSSVESFLDPFEHHPALTLVKDYFFAQLESTDIRIHFLPFFSDEMYVERLVQIASNYTPSQTNRDILFTHIGVSGAIMNNGMNVEGVSQNSFGLFDKVYIGHYHDKQIFDKFNYIGSSIQHNYGEDPAKGLTILYTDLSFETLELKFPRYVKLEVDVNKLSLSDIEEIRKEKENSGDNIRVVLMGEEKDLKSFNKQSLLDLGISVQVKAEEINRSDIEERVEPYNSKSLFEEFELFCQKHKLNKEQGRKYLDRCLHNETIH